VSGLRLLRSGLPFPAGASAFRHGEGRAFFVLSRTGAWRAIQDTGEDVRAYIVKDASPAQFMSCLGPASNNVGTGLRRQRSSPVPNA
jgi:hypothetical protein